MTEKLFQSLGHRYVITCMILTRLFGSIGSRDVAAAIEKYTGVAVEQRFVVLPQPIKEIGLHEVGLQPHPDVEFDVTLDVIPA